ncbi:MAG: hypothetical protein NVSMB23_12430 [Myxococcales bacterium]
MKARQLGATLTSSLALAALLLAALQMLVLFHAGRAGEQAALQAPGANSVVAPGRQNAWPAEPRREPERPVVKPPREPHPPTRQFRHNEFAPRPSRKASA